MFKTIQAMVPLAILLAPTAASWAQTSNFLGHAWIEGSEGMRLAYAAGLLDGATWVGPMAVGHVELVEKISVVLPNRDAPITGLGVAGVFLGLSQDAFRTVKTTRVLKDGLDGFFKDIRNRNIAVRNGALVVIAQLQGVPQAEVEAMVERLRVP